MNFMRHRELCLLVFLLSSTFSLSAFSVTAGKNQEHKNQPSHPSGHRHLADDIRNMKDHYQHLVIGSGYGASVAALRLAQSGQEVAILERGREWLPGDFPETLPQVAAAVRSPLNPLGLIHIDTSLKSEMDVIGASALGGTSTLNAAITLRPPDNVFLQQDWPQEIRDDFERGVLSQDYDRAEGMLKPNVGPGTCDTPKAKAHLSAFPAGFPTGELTLNINHEEGRSQYGVMQSACTLCGNCCGGCNVGAKNTLTTNYIPAAKDLGAQIFTQVEVSHVEIISQALDSLDSLTPRYRVHLIIHEKNKLGMHRQKKQTVTANSIFLGAGSSGSTAILMRSQRNGFAMSSRLGTRVSANGDVLGFIYNSDVQTNIAANRDTRKLTSGKNPVGQTITVYGDYRRVNQEQPIEKQFVMLDGAVPRAFAHDLAQALGLSTGPSLLFRHPSKLGRVAKDLNPLGEELSSDGALNHSMLLLACGHDSCSGRYVLDSSGDISVRWPNMDQEPSFTYIQDKMREYAHRIGGTFIPNPRETFLGGNKLQATHPLGGAPMGDSVDTGVVNHRGQLFNPEGGTYAGFHIVDAAIIPRSLAAPPLITITAMAERSMRLWAEDQKPGASESCINALTKKGVSSN